MPIPVAERSKTRVCARSLAGIAGSNPARVWCLSLFTVACCHVQVSASGRSSIKRTPTECGLSLCVWCRNLNDETVLVRVGLLSEEKAKGKLIPLQAWTFLQVSRRLRLPGFLDNQHLKMVKLSALCNGRLYPQGRSLVFISVTGWVDPRTLVRSEELN